VNLFGNCCCKAHFGNQEEIVLKNSKYWLAGSECVKNIERCDGASSTEAYLLTSAYKGIRGGGIVAGNFPF